MIVETLKDIEKGNITSISQSDELSTYAPMISKETGKIDWNKNGDNIVNLVRGLKPWPSAYMVYKGEKVKIHKARVVEKFIRMNNGIIVKVSDEGIYVNCYDSCVVIEELQFPGKKKLSVA